MSVGSEASGGAINHWSRFLGISLRPWSGRSPWGLVVRGVIQVLIYGFLLIQMVRLSNGEYETLPGEIESLTGLLVMLGIVFGVLLIMAVAMVLVGALDLVPRRTVRGRVIGLRERKMGDFLPEFVQDMIFARHENGLDRRRGRMEVELATDDGVRQWTVRQPKVRRELAEHQGAPVRLSVSPLLGYVSSVTSDSGTGSQNASHLDQPIL